MPQAQGETGSVVLKGELKALRTLEDDLSVSARVQADDQRPGARVAT